VRAPRRCVAGLLIGGLLLAVATPWLLAHSRPGVAPYLLHPAVFLIQPLPYVLAAALLVPEWGWSSDRVSLIVAGIVSAVSLMLYVPVLSAQGQWGGDMIALAFLAMSGAVVVVVVVASGVGALVHRRSRMSDGSVR
jgi:hypothetical protein